MQPLSSVTTGLAEAATQRKPTGAEPSALASPRSPDGARAWLAVRTPAQTDEAIRVSLRSQLGVDVRTRREWRHPEGKPSYPVEIMDGLTGLSTATQSQAIARVEAALTGPSKHDAGKLVAQMQAVLARRNNDADGAEIAFDVYVHVLMKHPMDVAKAVVERLCTEPREGGATAWMPDPTVIEGLCREAEQPRLSLLAGLKAWREPSPEQAEADRLKALYRDAQREATALEQKVGPGPATDDGPRGERIEAARLAQDRAAVAKLHWLNAQKRVDTARKVGA